MYISIDAGGTSTRVAGSLELESPVFVGEPMRRKNAHDFDDDVNFMVGAASLLADGETIDAVGIGAPGTPNHDKTEITWAVNLGSWEAKPLVATLQDELACPVFYDNDAAVSGLGEAYYGGMEGAFDYLVWGTGIGGGSVRYQNDKPNFKELDWTRRFARWHAAVGGSEVTKEFGKTPEDFTAAEWAAITARNQKHLQQYVETYKPSAIVFGGGLAVKHAQLLMDEGEKLNTKIAVTKFGDDGGLFGGFGLIKRLLLA